jgi:hypothetical protein
MTRALGRAVARGEQLLRAHQRRLSRADWHRDHQHRHRDHERHAPAQLPKTIHVQLPQSAERTRVPHTNACAA